MKGTILHFDEVANEGLITTDSGRFKFVITEWKSSFRPKIGLSVDFLIDSENIATEIYAEQNIESLSDRFQEIIKSGKVQDIIKSDKVQGFLHTEQAASLKGLMLEVLNPKTSVLSKGIALSGFMFKKSKSDVYTENIESPLSFKDKEK